MTTGVVYLKIRCELAQDIDKDIAQKFVEELDYHVKSNIPQVTVENTEIVDWGTNFTCGGK